MAILVLFRLTLIYSLRFYVFIYCFMLFQTKFQIKKININYYIHEFILYCLPRYQVYFLLVITQFFYFIQMHISNKKVF